MFTGNDFYGKPLDIWASGVTLYNMVYGKLPFDESNPIALKK